jgi:hypothetical protein
LSIWGEVDDEGVVVCVSSDVTTPRIAATIADRTNDIVAESYGLS